MKKGLKRRGVRCLRAGAWRNFWNGRTRRSMRSPRKWGYSSVSYFSTAFKKTFGQTPNEYQIHIGVINMKMVPRQRRDPDRRWYSYRTPYLLFWLQKKDKGAINHERIQYRQRIHGICGRRIYPFRQRSGLSGVDGIKEVPYGASFYN